MNKTEVAELVRLLRKLSLEFVNFGSTNELDTLKALLDIINDKYEY